ncbi:hypothetical protein [Methanimicrococcus blatticola]|nr:hypothetical protein [Methanimicrococcus blatticola]MBZ3936062.1 hypothetical protein [Methanimicrococcus blatticola]
MRNRFSCYISVLLLFCLRYVVAASLSILLYVSGCVAALRCCCFSGRVAAVSQVALLLFLRSRCCCVSGCVAAFTSNSYHIRSLARTWHGYLTVCVAAASAASATCPAALSVDCPAVLSVALSVSLSVAFPVAAAVVSAVTAVASRAVAES